MQLNLAGKTALVTGASAGIGREIACCLAAEGVHLALTARREASLREFAADLKAAGAQQVAVIPADISERASHPLVASAATEALGRVDIVINCAGASRPIDLDADDEIWDDSFALNFTAARRLTKLLLPGMQARRWGRVISISSSGEPRSLNAAGVAKAAMHAWAKGLASAVAKDGVTVNTIAPGRIWSEQVRERVHLNEQERQAFIAANIPIGRFGEPEELAVVATFLASPLASYVTGTVVPVDGGMRRFSL
ncbi:SDR family NAD(P)-dependent oxidoreductase [Paraburkholderia caffeinilytica]|uniref:SDR family NAD(P)-dependent oxidoreductase n=1 Tax=Paraburkholderia caffeinilytica TaxID=1761016 RepID=UPI0038B8F2B8